MTAKSNPGTDRTPPNLVNSGLAAEIALFHKKARAMNEALVLSSIRQHKLAEAADWSNAQLQAEIVARKQAENEILHLNTELEQRVAERTEQLQAANHELEAFSYSVSHDLRAPLRHVMGFVELLQKDLGPSLSPRNLGWLNTISESAKRMGELIDDLLDFARVGRAEMQLADVNLDALVRDVVKNFTEETAGRNIAWKIHALPLVRADRPLLRMVLVNLISNAVKFTGARTAATIEIGCLPGKDNPVPETDGAASGPVAAALLRGETIFFIRDNGAGFDPEYAGKLFGVFQRLHGQEEFEGTGIGLANIQRIIHRHGGRVWAEGAVEAGATFYFSLPKQNGGSGEH